MGGVVLRFARIVLSAAIILLVAGCVRCGCEYEDEGGGPTRDDFIRYNRRLFWCDSFCIAKYSDSLGLNSQPTKSNLWLTIHKQGTGPMVVDGDKVTLDYVATTLLGDTVYTSSADGRITMIVGKVNVCQGLDEAVRSLRHGGAEATAILIPEMAFGVRGDDNKIHGRLILRYDIHLLD